MRDEVESRTDDPIAEMRQEIDFTDRELIRLIARRFDVVRRIAATKISGDDTGLLDIVRERDLLAAWTRDAETLGLPPTLARKVLRELLTYSRRAQETVSETPGRHGPRVAYQGVQASYSMLAATHLLSTRSRQPAEFTGFESFGEVVEALQTGAADYAFLPVENSIGGSILDVNRLICDQSLAIVDEEVWEIEHVLAALPGTRLQEIRRVRTHPAAFSQCETFLQGLDGVAREAWFDTAGAAASLVAGTDRDVAAICSEEAAAEHGLEVLERRIADRDRNETRFLLLAREPEAPDPRIPCKTSVVFRLNHHEGALARALAAFADAGANLTRIESRPLPSTPWEYLFFVDVEGDHRSPRLADALRRAKACCNQLRVLGSYPHRARRELHLDQPVSRPVQHAPVVETTPPPAIESNTHGTPRALTDLQDPARRTVVRVGTTMIGGDRFVLIAGPCAVESRGQIFDAARMVRDAGATVLRGGAFKPRTSPYSFQGLGVEGLAYLRDAGHEYDLPVVTEIVRIEDILSVEAHADMIQVGARNMQNFPLLRELGKLDKPVLLKRGMSATVKELLLAAEYILSAGNQQVVLCERGIRTFETSTRSTLDLSSVPVLKRRTHLPVIVDPSHAAGDRDLVVPLALAAVAVGADGLIVEVHPRPEEAQCDREQALDEGDLRRLAAGIGPIVTSLGRTW